MCVCIHALPILGRPILGQIIALHFFLDSVPSILNDWKKKGLSDLDLHRLLDEIRIKMHKALNISVPAPVAADEKVEAVDMEESNLVLPQLVMDPRGENPT